jgi:hypothetical protein
MSKEKNPAPKTQKGNPELPKAETIAPKAIPSPKPQAETTPADDKRAELVKKAQAAKQAALVGLIDQAKADKIWKEAEEACKPTEESLALAKDAKEKKEKADKILKAALAAKEVGLVTEDVVKDAQAKADAAKADYDQATKAAKGFSLGAGGGGMRFKGQMSGLDAAFKILSASKEPMNIGAITKEAIEQGLWSPEGQTPAATLSAALQTDIKKGDKARFVKVREGHYAVRKVATE